MYILEGVDSFLSDSPNFGAFLMAAFVTMLELIFTLILLIRNTYAVFF